MSLADALTLIVVVWLGLSACYAVCWGIERLRASRASVQQSRVKVASIRRRAGYWTSQDNADSD